MTDNSKKREAIGKYDVGYCRPPKSGQFKKGQSGNPRGRPRRPPERERTLDRNQVELDLLGLLERDVPIVVSGKRRKVTTAELLDLKLIEKAKNGDFRSLKYLKTLREKYATDRGRIKAEMQGLIFNIKERMFDEIAKEPNRTKHDKIIHSYVELLDSEGLVEAHRRANETVPKKRL